MRYVRRVRERLGPDSRHLIRDAPVAFALKVAGAGFTLLLNLVLARQLGPVGVGMFFLAVGVVTIAAVVGRFGMDHALVRHVASSAAAHDWAAVKGTHNTGIAVATGSASAVAILTALAAPWLAHHVFDEPDLAGHVRVMALAIVPFALFVLYAQSLKGLKRFKASLALQGIWLPSIAAVGVIVLAPSLGVRGAVTAYVVACCVTLAIAVLLWRAATPDLRRVRASWNWSRLLTSSVPMFWSSLFQLIVLWSPTLMLGAWATSAEVGVFGIASRIAMLVSFVLVAVNSVTAPRFAAHHATGNTQALRKVARDAALVMALVAAPPFLVFMVFAPQVMALFGAQFSEGASLLQIVAVGQYVNVVTGSVGMLLVMTGHESTMRNIMAASAGIILLLNVILVPLLGAVGAALAFALVLIVQNVAAAYYVWRRLGFNPLPLIRARGV